MIFFRLLLCSLMIGRSISILETVCVEGFIMDRKCIDLGYLLDNRSLHPLKNPDQHTVHCLVDIPSCYKSGFSILVPNPGGETKYKEAYQLDSKGNELLLRLSREVGNKLTGCTSCIGGGSGKIRVGMRATVIGVVDKTIQSPQQLLVKEVHASPKLFDSNSEIDGCRIATTTPTTPTTTPTTPTTTPTTPTTTPTTPTTTPTTPTTTPTPPPTTTTTPTTTPTTPTTTPTTTIKIPPRPKITMCVEGFVMDRKCIELGFLLDKSDLKTLENPEQHTVHCLVDVPFCYNTGFSILVPNPEKSPKYMEAVKLDSVGNAMVMAHARELGDSSCTTCNGSGNLTIGLRATVIGEVLDQKSLPLTLNVKQIKLSPKLYNPNSEDNGCPKISTTTTEKTTTVQIGNPDSAAGKESSSGQWIKSSLVVSLLLPLVISSLLKIMF